MYERIENTFKNKSFTRFVKISCLVTMTLFATLAVFVFCLFLVHMVTLRDLLPSLFIILPLMLGPSIVYYIQIVVYLYSHKYISGFLGFFKFTTNLNVFTQAVHLQDIKLLKDILFIESITSKENLLEVIRHYQQKIPRRTIGSSSFVSIMALSIAVLSLFFNDQVRSSNEKVLSIIAILATIVFLYLAFCWLNKEYFKYLSQSELLRRIESSLSEIYFDFDIYFPQNVQPKRYEFLFAIKSFLNSKQIAYDKKFIDKIQMRVDGHKFSLSEHLQAFTHSFLSHHFAQLNSEDYYEDIDKIFFNYSINEILKNDTQYYIFKLNEINFCNSQLKKHIMALIANVQTLNCIEHEKGGLDNFIMSQDMSDVFRVFTEGKYRLKCVNESVIWLYLNYVGFDGAHSSESVRRFLGIERMHFSRNILPSRNEAQELLNKLSKESGLTIVEIDKAIDLYCAQSQANICVNKPNCSQCVIRKFCKGTDNN